MEGSSKSDIIIEALKHAMKDAVQGEGDTEEFIRGHIEKTVEMVEEQLNEANWQVIRHEVMLLTSWIVLSRLAKTVELQINNIQWCRPTENKPDFTNIRIKQNKSDK